MQMPPELSRTAVLFAIGLIVMTAHIANAESPAVKWTTSGRTLTASTSTYALTVDAKSGEPISLTSHGKMLVTFGGAGWWKITNDDGSTITTAECSGAVTHDNTSLLAIYNNSSVDVRIRANFHADRIDLVGHVASHDRTVKQFLLPAAVTVDPATLNKVYFPEELGRALLPPFFRPVTGAFARWDTTSIGTVGAKAVGVGDCQMLDWNQPADPVTVTNIGRQRLGEDASRLSTWTAVCPRAPVGSPDVVLLNTPSGPLLSLQSVDGGYGWFVRWGGVFSQQDIRQVGGASAALVSWLWNNPIPTGASIHPSSDQAGKAFKDTEPNRVGVIDLRLTSYSAFGPSTWERILTGRGRRSSTPTEPVWEIVHLRTVDDILATLRSHNCWLIVNPFGEVLPSDPAHASDMEAAIRDYLAHGGIWLHTGGAPFYYDLQPKPYLSVEGSYPPLFSDFMHVDGSAGELSIYGVQNQNGRFIPGHLAASGNPGGGLLERGWMTWIAPDTDWTSPTCRLVVGSQVQSALDRYGRENGFFTRPLADKIKPDILAKLKLSILLNCSDGSFHDQAARIQSLPSPLLVHMVNYLHGGFDKQYPDHLPPNPAFGTPADFLALIKTAHNKGDIVMPYTNPTWWCDDPPGPTFQKWGKEPLLKDVHGKPIQEVYGRNRGWKICTYHPAVIASEKVTLDEFTKQYPVDMMFQDQIGARSPDYDFNPASPDPVSNAAGMQDIARRDSQTLPLGTENGYDAILDSETMYCGICWGLVPTEYGPDWVTLWQGNYPPDSWRFAPLALWMAHDKAVFGMHDLGQFVTNPETLAWNLALGYQLSTRLFIGAADDNKRADAWTSWLCALQSTIGRDIIGAPLNDWQEPSIGVYRAVYGSTIVLSNTTNVPYPIDAADVLAPFGFRITDHAGNVIAGSYIRYRSTAYDQPYSFVNTTSGLVTAPPSP